jgi:hypothetical protein
VTSDAATMGTMARLRAGWGRIAGNPALARWITLGVFIVLTGWYIAFAVQRWETSHLYGDEPEYLFEGRSVWRDGDLDLRNQYLHPGRHAFPGPLVFKVDPAGGPARPNFMPTSGVILEPIDLAFGLLGVYLAYAAMNLVSLWLMHGMLRRNFGPIPSALAVGTIGLSVPLAWHAASLWTEIPAVLCVMGVLRLVPLLETSRWARAGAGLLLAFLPWLHQKYGFLVAGIVVALLLDRRRWRLWPWLVGFPVVGIIGTVLFSEWIQGRANFTQSGTTDAVSSGFDTSISRFVAQPFAWFFDQTRGYLPLAPIWVLAGVGLLFLLREARGRSMLLFLLVAFGPYYVVYFAGPFLGGDAPPGRETLAALPALGVLLAAAYCALRGAFAITVAGLLAIPSLYLGTKPAFQPGMDVFFNNQEQPKLLLYLSGGRQNWADLWPRITSDPHLWSRSKLLLLLIAAAAVAGTIYLSSKLAAQRRRDRPWTFPSAAWARSALPPAPP